MSEIGGGARRNEGFGKALRLAAAITLPALLTGCAETERVAQTAWDGTKRAAEDAHEGMKGAFEKLAKYTKIADLLKKNHDSQNDDDAPVVDVIEPKATSAPKGHGKPSAKKASAPKPASPARPRQERAEMLTPRTKPSPIKGELTWPVEAGIISSEFGPRWGRMHKGIDIAAETGEPILAAADGEVIYSGNGLSGYGNVVILRHDAHTTTLYGHNSALKCRVGERVKAGQTIALLGSTGHSTGPHCHFEVRDDREAVNPRTHLARSRIFEERTLLAERTKRKA